MKSKLNEAIDTAFELVKQSWLNGGKHDMNLAIALDQLEPYVGQPWATYDAERRAHFRELMDIYLEDFDEELTNEEIDRLLDWLIDADDDDEDGAFSDKLYGAGRDCGLLAKMYGESEEA